MALSLRDSVHHRYDGFIPGSFSVKNDVLSLAKYDVGEQAYRTADGHVSLRLLLSALEQTPPSFHFTGHWLANDGAFYYLRQEENGTLWWVGLSNDPDPAVNNLQRGLQFGLSFSNVFKGQIGGSIIEGEWVDVPRGESLHNGSLSLVAIITAGDEVSTGLKLQKIASSGDGYGASLWTQIKLAEPPDFSIHDAFNNVKKNQNAYLDHSLLDGLKPYKDSAVVFCTVIKDPDLPSSDQDQPGFPQWHVNYPPPSHAGRTYKDFICLNDNDSPPDADLNAHIQLRRDLLDASATFWTDGWVNNAKIIQDKLDASGNQLHFEVIMFGRVIECGDPSHFNSPPLLPGWQEMNGNSVLLNGRPINGVVDIGDPLPGHDGKEYYVKSVVGKTIANGTQLRVTGVVILDCGHASGLDLRPCYDESDFVALLNLNQEIHPVYAIDIINATSSDLSGTWSDDDGRTFYLRQLGDNTIWGLGMSPFRDHSFARVFQGTIQPDRLITVHWVDLPLGQGQNTGSMTLRTAGPGNKCLFDGSICRFVSSSDLAVDQRWTKLYDIPPPV